MLYTINKPLMLLEGFENTWLDISKEKLLVRKESEFVSKEIAIELLNTLKEVDKIIKEGLNNFDIQIQSFFIINQAITNAEK